MVSFIKRNILCKNLQQPFFFTLSGLPKGAESIGYYSKGTEMLAHAGALMASSGYAPSHLSLAILFYVLSCGCHTKIFSPFFFLTIFFKFCRVCVYRICSKEWKKKKTSSSYKIGSPHCHVCSFPLKLTVDLSVPDRSTK